MATTSGAPPPLKGRRKRMSVISVALNRNTSTAKLLEAHHLDYRPVHIRPREDSQPLSAAAQHVCGRFWAMRQLHEEEDSGCLINYYDRETRLYLYHVHGVGWVIGTRLGAHTYRAVKPNSLTAELFDGGDWRILDGLTADAVTWVDAPGVEAVPFEEPENGSRIIVDDGERPLAPTIACASSTLELDGLYTLQSESPVVYYNHAKERFIVRRPNGGWIATNVSRSTRWYRESQYTLVVLVQCHVLYTLVP